jgi:hypothetical protein
LFGHAGFLLHSSSAGEFLVRRLTISTSHTANELFRFLFVLLAAVFVFQLSIRILPNLGRIQAVSGWLLRRLTWALSVVVAATSGFAAIPKLARSSTELLALRDAVADKVILAPLGSPVRQLSSFRTFSLTGAAEFVSPRVDQEKRLFDSNLAEGGIGLHNFLVSTKVAGNLRKVSDRGDVSFSGFDIQCIGAKRELAGFSFQALGVSTCPGISNAQMKPVVRSGQTLLSASGPEIAGQEQPRSIQTDQFRVASRKPAYLDVQLKSVEGSGRGVCVSLASIQQRRSTLGGYRIEERQFPISAIKTALQESRSVRLRLLSTSVSGLNPMFFRIYFSRCVTEGNVSPGLRPHSESRRFGRLTLSRVEAGTVVL